MEVGTIQNNKRALFAAEFFGTAFLLIAVFFTSWFHHNPLTIAIGVSSGLIIAIISFGRYSGAHFNPSLTLSYFFFLQRERKKHISTCLVMISAQFSGALCGGLMLTVINGMYQPKLLPKKDNLTGAFINEAFFTFMFFTLIFCVKNSKHNFTSDSFLGALACSVALCGMILYGGSLSGACYNPAVGLSFIFWSSLASYDITYWRYLPFYFVAPTLGAFLAGALVRYFIEKEDELSFVKEAEKRLDLFKL